MKIRRGWYLVDMTANEEERRIDEKEKKLERRRDVLMQRCDKKILRQQLQAEQRQAYEKEKLMHAQRAINLKQREIETSHKLAAELSRRKSRVENYNISLNLSNIYLFNKEMHFFIFLLVKLYQL